MFERVVRAIKADPELFELVEHDEGYTGEAGIIVAIASVLSGFGALFAGRGFSGFIGTIIATFIGWFIWSGVTMFIGTRVFGGTASFGEMVRVIGYSYAPQILGIIPIIGFIALLWSLWVAVVAIRQGLDFTTGKAIGTALLGWLALVLLNLLLGGMLF